ncbi:MAG: hypothetical protein R2792_19910 [Saprospiraceae bacterium]
MLFTLSESIELMRGDGEIVWCSKTEHADLFWQTCGGMGWTGVILSARFRLRPIQSMNMQQKAVRGSNLDGTVCSFESHAHYGICSSLGRLSFSRPAKIPDGALLILPITCRNQMLNC